MPARSLLTKYIQPLPLPGSGIVVATPSGMNQYAFTLREIARQLHPNLSPTPLWAYDDGSGLGGQAGSFGMAVVAQSGTALDVSYTSNLPEFYPDWIPVDTRETPCTHNPLGVKGCGEAGAIGAPAAVMNAICDAIGVKDLEMPATPERVWRAIQNGRRA